MTAVSGFQSLGAIQMSVLRQINCSEFSSLRVPTCPRVHFKSRHQRVIPLFRSNQGIVRISRGCEGKFEDRNSVLGVVSRDLSGKSFFTGVRTGRTSLACDFARAYPQRRCVARAVEAGIEQIPSDNLEESGDSPQELTLEEAANLKKELLEMLNDVTRLQQDGQEAKARELLEANLAGVEDEMTNGRAGVEQAAVLVTLGLAYLELRSDEDKFRRVMNEAVKLVEEVKDPQPMLEYVLEVLGDLTLNMGRPSDAVSFFARGLLVQQHLAGGKQELQDAKMMYKLGEALHKCGDTEGCIDMFKNANRLVEEHEGPKAPSLGYNLAVVANMMCQVGQLEEAQSSAQRAVDIVKETKGPISAELGTILCSTVSNLYEQRGEMEEAMQTVREGLRIMLESGELRSSDLTVLLARTQLAGLLQRVGRGDEARRELHQNLKSQSDAFGAESPRLIPPLAAMADSHIQEEQWDESEPYLRRAVGLARSQPDIPMEDLLQKLAVCLNELGKSEEAEELAREVMKLLEEMEERNELRIANSCAMLAAILHLQGGANKTEEAEKLMWRAMLLTENVAGNTDAKLAPLIQAQLEILKAQGKRDACTALQTRLAAVVRRNNLSY